MADEYWSKLHSIYSDKDWAAKPSLFAETVKGYLPQTGRILELGAGLGQDSAYFAGSGYQVVATDLNIEHLQQLAHGKFTVEKVDLRQPLPYSEVSFDIIYAHLSLHYFDEETTKQIFAEIHRVLKPGGILAFFTNSTDDPEFNTGIKLEANYFDIEGTFKRYFDITTAKRFASNFEPLLIDNNGETYKDSAEGIHNLIRFIGVKR